MTRGTAVLVAIPGLLHARDAWSQAVDNLPDYLPLLPQVKAKALAVNPKKG